MAVDLPFLDDSVTRLPTDIREALAERGRNDLYFFNKAILGHRDVTESCHGPGCALADLNPAQFKMFLWPRDHLKTSCLTIGGGMQRVVKNPEHRQLIANESGTNSQRFLRSIRQHAEGNRVFRALYSDVIPKDTRKVRWNDSELDFNRQGHYPEPTIDSIGMTGAVVSRHYNHITYDDPISEEAVKSDKVMQDTITRMSGALSLLIDPSVDTIWLVGTRWALFDCYSEWMRLFGTKLARVVRAALELDPTTGVLEPIWPERFSHETLALKRAMMKEYKFSCLMMNNPRNEALQDLNVQDLRFWRYDSDESHLILYDGQDNEIRRVAFEDLDVTCAVDLAPAEKATDDRNAITTVGVTPWNEAIVLESWARRCTPLDVIEHLFTVKSRWAPRVFGIESVAYQKAFKYFLKQECNRRTVYMNITELKNASTKKEQRIRGLQPLMATSRLFVKPTEHLLRNEMADFPLGEHDDAVDSLSMHLQLFRGQMSPEWWTKYRIEEEKLIRRIRSKQTGAYQPRQLLDSNGRPLDPFDYPDEEEDEFSPIRQRSITEVRIA